MLSSMSDSRDRQIYINDIQHKFAGGITDVDLGVTPIYLYSYDVSIENMV